MGAVAPKTNKKTNSHIFQNTSQLVLLSELSYVDNVNTSMSERIAVGIFHFKAQVL